MPSLKHLEGFCVTGLSTRTHNRDEFNEQTAKLPTLWQQFLASDLAHPAHTFGVYSDYESDANGLYTVTVGIASDEPKSQHHTVQIQTGHYLAFQGKGPMPAAVIAAWQRVWNYFETENQYQRNFTTDFEAYQGSDEVTIYIGVK